MTNDFWMQHLDLQNFRRFRSVSVEFERDLTVLVGSNAGGKTALLDALTILLGSYVGAFDAGRGPGFRKTDAHVRSFGSTGNQEEQFPVVASGLLHAGGGPMGIRRELRGAANRTTSVDAAKLRNLAKRLQENVRAGDDRTVLPLIAYYGTGRMWRQLPTQARVTRSRLAGYANCLEPVPNYRVMASWMRWATLTKLQSSQRAGEEQSRLASSVLDNLQSAAACVLSVTSERPEQRVVCHDVRYDFEDDAVVADLELAEAPAVKLPVGSLSDGIRGVLGLVADLAIRAAILNPHLGGDARLHVPGIVLIDEIDLHLHPRWQQQVLPQLRRAFPSVQLMVTTHSPQVLSTAEARSIRQLDQISSGDGRLESRYHFTKGHESGEILRRVQEVPERAPGLDETKLLESYMNLIDKGAGDSTEARALRVQLDAYLGGPEYESALRRADVALRVLRHRRS